MQQGMLLLAGSYAAADQPGLRAFRLNLASGALLPHGECAGVLNPSFLLLHPHRRWLYAVSETGPGLGDRPGHVAALQFSAQPWRCELINSQPSGGDYPCHLALDASGGWLLVANYGSGSVAVLPLQEDGSLGAPTDLVQHAGSGPNKERQEGAHAHSASFSPDGRFVIMADLGMDALLVYRLDAVAGKLHEHSRVATRPGAGPRHMVFHPGGRLLYVANELDNTVVVYDYAAASAGLTERQVVSTLVAGAPHNQVAEIRLAPAADRLYVSNRGHNSLAVFAVDSGGLLEQLATPGCGGDWPRHFALTPGGQFAVVANQYSGSLTVLPLRQDGQEVGAPVADVPVPQVSCVHFI